MFEGKATEVTYVEAKMTFLSCKGTDKLEAANLEADPEGTVNKISKS